MYEINKLSLRALPLYEMLDAVPAFRALRHALPDARITLVSLPSAQDLVKRFHAYLDDFIAFPGLPGLTEQPSNVRLFPSFLNTVHQVVENSHTVSSSRVLIQAIKHLEKVREYA